MKSALECNPHSNVIRNFWEKKKKEIRGLFSSKYGIPLLYQRKIAFRICRLFRQFLSGFDRHISRSKTANLFAVYFPLGCIKIFNDKVFKKQASKK